MGYRLAITEAAGNQLDNLVFYLLYELQNESAASNLLNHIQKIYYRLEENPYQFPMCSNPLLYENEYREAILTEMDYVVIFRVETECVYVVGIFHQLENYPTYFII